MSIRDPEIEKTLSELRGYTVTVGDEVDAKEVIEVDIDGRRHTVEPRPIYEFEEEIYDYLIEPKVDPSVTGASIPFKGRWIHGWLNEKDEDYINSIWKGYQLFVKYVEAKSSRLGNVGTINRSPGTYDSMYRYILVLEELDLVDRHRREEVPESEYDFPVPDEFRVRTYVKNTASYEEFKDSWDNPYGTLYSDSESEEIDDEDTDSDGTSEDEPEPDDSESDDSEDSGVFPFTVDIDETETSDGPSTSGFGIDQDQDEDESDVEGVDITGDENSIQELPEPDRLVSIIDEEINSVIRDVLDESMGIPSMVSSSDFDYGRAAVVGSWANPNTDSSETMSIVLSIDDSDANSSPGLILSGVQRLLPKVLESNNPYPGLIAQYEIIAVYDSAFKTQVETVSRNKSQSQYFNLSTMETETL